MSALMLTISQLLFSLIIYFFHTIVVCAIAGNTAINRNVHEYIITQPGLILLPFIQLFDSTFRDNLNDSEVLLYCRTV